MARGRCYACLNLLQEANKDLSIALNLDDTVQEAYVNRGKCAYLMGDNNLAFLDFQKLILTDPVNFRNSHNFRKIDLCIFKLVIC